MKNALKWVLGCLGVGVLLILGVCYFGYRQVKNMAGEGTPSVTIQAPANRVFANLADADSMAEWRTEGLGIRAKRKGLLHVGDTIVIQMRGPMQRENRSTWIVSDVKPERVFAVDLLGARGTFVASRRDSIVAYGESTQVFSSFAVQAGGADSASGAGGMAMNLMRTAQKAQARMELGRLKAILQGDSVPPRPPQNP